MERVEQKNTSAVAWWAVPTGWIDRAGRFEITLSRRGRHTLIDKQSRTVRCRTFAQASQIAEQRLGGAR